MPDKKLTDNEIVKAKKLIEKLKEAYDFYYDVSKSMPYDIDTTLRETAISFENCLNEISRLQAEVENYKQVTEHQQSVTLDKSFEIKRLKEEVERLNFLLNDAYENNRGLVELFETAKAEAYKECIEKVKLIANETCVFDPDIPLEDTAVYHISKIKLNNILKELVGEDNA